MDEAARETLKKLKSEIKKNLNLDDDILDSLEANDTLKSDHVEKIRAEKTNSEKISTLLLILQRKGPEAFHAFVDALKADSGFLADKLQERYREEEKKLDKDSGNSSEESLEPTENQPKASNNCNTNNDVVISQSPGSQSIFPHVGSSCIQAPNRSQESTTVTSGTVIHEKVTPRRLSNHSTDLAVHPTNHFIHTYHGSRRTSSHSIDFATHQSLNGMYTKLKMHLFHINEREQSFGGSPVPVNFEMVEDLLDRLLKLVQDCYKAIGANNKDSLLTSIVNLKVHKGELQKNLYKKEEQVQKYATKILKLETKCKNTETTLKQQDHAIQALRQENRHLSEENERLKEEINKVKNTEENVLEFNQKTMNLRQVSKQNEELKTKVARYETELDMMTLKFNTLNQQTMQHASEASDHNRKTVNGTGHKKGTYTKQGDCDWKTSLTQPGLSSTLQECKEMCAGTNSDVKTNYMKQMRTKILFAEAKQNGSKKAKTALESNDILKRVLAADKLTINRGQNLREEVSMNVEEHDQTLQNHESEKISRASNKLTILTQKSPSTVKKPGTSKNPKKYPKWIRKPLR